MHHPLSTKAKEAVLKNFYKTAREVSSGREETLHSLEIVDNLAKKNGYKPRRPVPQPTSQRRRHTSEYKAPLKLPYVSEEVSSKIRTYIRKKETVSQTYIHTWAWSNLKPTILPISTVG